MEKLLVGWPGSQTVLRCPGYNSGCPAKSNLNLTMSIQFLTFSVLLHVACWTFPSLCYMFPVLCCVFPFWCRACFMPVASEVAILENVLGLAKVLEEVKKELEIPGYIMVVRVVDPKLVEIQFQYLTEFCLSHSVPSDRFLHWVCLCVFA